MIKVLIVDDIPETRDHLTKLLSFEEGIDVAGGAGSGDTRWSIRGKKGGTAGQPRWRGHP